MTLKKLLVTDITVIIIRLMI